MKDKNNTDLRAGDLVNCYPDAESIADHEFTGRIKRFRLMGGIVLAVVVDQNDACYDMESHELELCLDC